MTVNDKEKAAFRAVFEFYARWRETVIETPEQWEAFAEDAGKTGEAMDVKNCRLGLNLLTAAVETIGWFYEDGRKPMPANYFGREDI